MNVTSVVLFVIGIVFLVFSFSLKMSNFLDVRTIFSEHLSVFKGNPLQLVSIFIVPALFSVGIVKIRCIDREILNNLNIVLSILIAMFFSTLSILCAFADKDNRKPMYKRLLKETNRTVADICQTVGYSDVRYFSKTFAKYSGLKPNEYRKLYS